MRRAGFDFGPGFHGKMPSRGDFVSHRLPPEFLRPWTDWLSRALQGSRDQLGSRWPMLFQLGPVWRFALAPGLCGAAAVAGVMVPGADKLGRPFPFVLAASLPHGADLVMLPLSAAAWFTRAATLALTAVDPTLEFERFCPQVDTLDRPAPALSRRCVAPAAPPLRRLALERPDDLAPTQALLAQGLSESLPGAASLWWTAGSGRVAPSLLICDGLPRTKAFAALLDGDWSLWGWR